MDVQGGNREREAVGVAVGWKNGEFFLPRIGNKLAYILSPLGLSLISSIPLLGIVHWQLIEIDV